MLGGGGVLVELRLRSSRLTRKYPSGSLLYHSKFVIVHGEMYADMEAAGHALQRAQGVDSFGEWWFGARCGGLHAGRQYLRDAIRYDERSRSCCQQRASRHPRHDFTHRKDTGHRSHYSSTVHDLDLPGRADGFLICVV